MQNKNWKERSRKRAEWEKCIKTGRSPLGDEGWHWTVVPSKKQKIYGTGLTAATESSQNM